MLKKIFIILTAIIGILIILVIAGYLFNSSKDSSEAAAETSSSSIFEEVSNLEALELGIIDGQQLREQNGISDIEDENIDNENEAVKSVNVFMTLRSVQDDIKIKILNSENSELVSNVGFEVTVKGNDKTLTYTDTDKDGIIYI